jgi:hypothetical protein
VDQRLMNRLGILNVEEFHVISASKFNGQWRRKGNNQRSFDTHNRHAIFVELRVIAPSARA